MKARYSSSTLPLQSQGEGKTRAALASSAHRAIIACCPLVFLLVAPTSGQDVTIVAGKGRKPAKLSVDVERCIDCHQTDEVKLKNPDYKAEARKMVRLDEANIWWTQDLHRKAFSAIIPQETAMPGGKPNLAWQMEKVLQQSPSRKKLPNGEVYQVTRAAECLTCHAVDTSWKPAGCTADDVTPALLDDLEKPRFDTRFGVSCEACHGIVDRSWGLDHAETDWRERLPAAKLEKGQLDLRDPAIRAERCASCHVGSAAEHKFVTHEMYAAGHPPLPPLELATYAREQPRHAVPGQSNKYFADELSKNAASLETRFHYRKNENSDARALAYGSLVGFRSALNLLAADAADKAKNGGLLDFAHFDCASCHHDLKNPSERQQRRGGVPGRPFLKAPTELLDVVLDHAAASATDPQLPGLRLEHAKLLQSLRQAFDAKPFGDLDALQTAATKLVKLEDDILPALGPIIYEKEVVSQLTSSLASQLAKSGKEEHPAYLDYDAALQLAWAWVVLNESSKTTGSQQAAQNRLGNIIGLTLRDSEKQESVQMRLHERFQKQYGYSSKSFYAAMMEMAEAHSNKPMKLDK